MLLYPALAIGFAFVAVPLLVHLINLLRHRRTKWAAMDFLLASYRKQRKWIVLRQLLLLLSRLALAAVLIALLAGLVGGKRLVRLIGGQTTHHVVVLDDSYSMQQLVASGSVSGGQVADAEQPSSRAAGGTAYDRGLLALAQLTRRLAADQGNHQLTVLRASRAALLSGQNSANQPAGAMGRGAAGDDEGGDRAEVPDGAEGGRSGDFSMAADAVADLAAQTVTGEGRQIDRVMSSRASPLRCDLTPALQYASDMLEAVPADVKTLYVISDFAKRDWASTQRIAEVLGKADESGAKIRMLDCADNRSGAATRNLAITDLSPSPDVWVAGVPVVVNVTVQNLSEREVRNVPLDVSVITYGEAVGAADPTANVSGEIQSLPAVMIEVIPPGQKLTKSFQVFIDREGTHVVRASLPPDALGVDNTRVCTLPLADAQRVLIVDGDADALGAYHVASVLNPGSQVRIGAVPDVQPLSRLRGISADELAKYRAVYLIDVPEIESQTAAVLRQFVTEGGGLAWFLGDGVDRERYNEHLVRTRPGLLPHPLGESSPLQQSGILDRDGSSNLPGGVLGEDEAASSDDGQQPALGAIVLGEDSEALGPISQAGNGIFSLVTLRRSWTFADSGESAGRPEEQGDTDDPGGGAGPSAEANPGTADSRVEVLLARADGVPLATRHRLGRGRVITVATGLDGQWNNWPGDPTFVVFLLQSNAMLFSGAAPPTSRPVDTQTALSLPPDAFVPDALLLPPADEPPRLAIELSADPATSSIVLSPREMMIADQSGLAELLRPGVIEWQRTTNDGRLQVVPVASVIRVDESDLTRAVPAELMRDLAPLDVEFLAINQWNEDGPVAGLSTFLLVLLALLALLLAVEQALAAWASYHPKATGSGRGVRRMIFRTERTTRRTRGEAMRRPGESARPAPSAEPPPRATPARQPLTGSARGDSR